MRRIIIDNIDLMDQEEENKLHESLREQNIGYVIKTITKEKRYGKQWNLR